MAERKTGRIIYVASGRGVTGLIRYLISPAARNITGQLFLLRTA